MMSRAVAMGTILLTRTQTLFIFQATEVKLFMVMREMTKLVVAVGTTLFMEVLVMIIYGLKMVKISSMVRPETTG